jgi:DNA polymerase
MSQSLNELCRAARQLIQADQLLTGGGVYPGSPLPDPSPPPAQSQAAQVQSGDGNAAAPTDQQAALDALDQAEVRSCRRCRLADGRTQTVFGEGSPNAQIMFIGEGPGEEEDRQGRPFVGRAGELLTRMIAGMGLSRRQVYIANVVKCRPPGNRAPMVDEAAACRDYLVRQIQIIRPKVLVTLGNPATHAMLQTTEGITKIRGQWRPLPPTAPLLEGIMVMPTFHPAYLLRSYTYENRKAVWSDLCQVLEFLNLPVPQKM